MPPSKKVAARLVSGLKRFAPVLAAAKSRDLNESDTVIIITDILYEIFGYDKYSEVTSEHAIRGTFCDLAIKLNDRIEFLIEAKAINADLKDAYVKQATDYAANKGIEWVILTNGELWRIYKVTFGKPIGNELVFEFNLLKLNPKSEDDLEILHLISKEAWLKAAINDYHTQKQALNKFILGAILLSDSVAGFIRKELRKLSPDVKIENKEITAVLMGEVIKREVVEGEKADEARKKILRKTNRLLKEKVPKSPPQALQAGSGDSIISDALVPETEEALDSSA